MEPLTKRQQQVLDFITHSIDERGYPPTMREIGEHMGIRSTNGVNDHLKALERKGYIEREDLKSRTLRPVGMAANDRAVAIPLVGRVAAGQPVLAIENHEQTLKVDPYFVGQSDGVFALRVVGDSMIDDGIFDGDIVFVRKQNVATKGETVVAMVDEEATVKRYYPEGNRIRLQPANESMEPIYIRPDQNDVASILGVVVGVFRRM